MRILLLVHLYPPQHHAGTENLTHGLAKELVAQGHSVRVLAGASTSETGGWDTHDGITVHRLPSAVVTHTNPDGTKAVEAEINSFRPDVLHALHLQRHGVGVFAAAARLGVPTVFTATDFWIRCPECLLVLENGRHCAGPDDDAANCLRHVAATRSGLSRLLSLLPEPAWRMAARVASSRPMRGFSAAAYTERSRVIREALSWASACIAPTEPVALALQQAGVPLARIHHIPYGLPDPGPIQAVTRGNRGTIRLGCMGTLRAYKGIHIAAQAVAALPPTASCTLDIWGIPAGDAAYLARLQRLCRQDGRIRLHPPFPPEEIGQKLAGLDLLLVPALWIENAPLIAASAMAAGCPVLGSDVPGIAAVVESGRSSVLLPPGDLSAWSAKLAEFVQHPDRIGALAQATRPTLPTMTEHVRRLDILYQDVMKRRT